MRLVNIKVRVDEELYTTTVVPNQQVRRLGGLVRDLLQAYSDNPTVRRIIDNRRDGLPDPPMVSDASEALAEILSRLDLLSTVSGNVVFQVPGESQVTLTNEDDEQESDLDPVVVMDSSVSALGDDVQDNGNDDDWWGPDDDDFEDETSDSGPDTSDFDLLANSIQGW